MKMYRIFIIFSPSLTVFSGLGSMWFSLPIVLLWQFKAEENSGSDAGVLGLQGPEGPQPTLSSWFHAGKN